MEQVRERLLHANKYLFKCNLFRTLNLNHAAFAKQNQLKYASELVIMISCNRINLGMDLSPQTTTQLGSFETVLCDLAL